MFRYIIFMIGLIPSTIFFSIVAILGPLIKNDALPLWSAHNWSRWLIWSAGIRLHWDLSNVPKDTNVVFLPNHQSLFDIPMLFVAFLPQKLGYVAKKSLFDIPLFGKAIAAAGMIPIDRENSRKAMRSIDNAVEAARQGTRVVIFPEGTWIPRTDKLGEFKIGGMIMALKCGLPVVPLVICGSGMFFPKGAKRFEMDARDITIKALPPINPDQYTLKERNKFRDDLSEQMNNAYQELLSTWPKLPTQ